MIEPPGEALSASHRTTAPGCDVAPGGVPYSRSLGGSFLPRPRHTAVLPEASTSPGRLHAPTHPGCLHRPPTTSVQHKINSIFLLVPVSCLRHSIDTAFLAHSPHFPIDTCQDVPDSPQFARFLTSSTIPRVLSSMIPVLSPQ